MKSKLSIAILIAVVLVASAAAQYLIPWQSINSGGRPGSGPGYNLNGSAGQAVQGTGTGTGYLGYWGFWYGWATGGGPSPSESGWVRKADVPAGPKNKNVKDGGCLTALSPSDRSDLSVGSDIYAFKGNGRYEFYRYNIASNTWEAKESIPAIGSSGKKKAVKKGASLTSAEGKVYGCKGNSTLDYWCYTPTADAYAWVAVAAIPTGAKPVKEGSGAAAATVGDTTYIYFLKGSGTQEFYRYNIPANSWLKLADAPLGTSGKAYKNGSCLTSDGASTVWALKGSYNELQAYDIVANTWTAKTSLPFIGNSGKKKKVKDGAGIAYSDDLVYGLKGGNTFEFWQYEADSDRWKQLADMPLGGGKKVKGGGALCAGEGKLFASKGNNTLEFYSYTPAADLSRLGSRSYNPASQNVGATSLSRFDLRVAPNPFTGTTTIRYTLPGPGACRLGLYDVTGKLVATLAAGYRTPGSYSISVHQRSSAVQLSSGVYLLKLETQNSELGTQVTTTKLIIE